MEYLTVKRNKLTDMYKTLINFKSSVVSGKSQAQKGIYYMILFI